MENNKILLHDLKVARMALLEVLMNCSTKTYNDCIGYMDRDINRLEKELENGR